MTARARCGCLRFREFGELLTVWQEISHEAEERCL